MIATLKLNNRYKIKPNEKGNFKVGDIQMSVDKVPFLRYNFENWNESDTDYIRGMMGTFNKSAHMIEMYLNSELKQNIESIEDLLDDVAKYLYIVIDDTNVTSCDIGDNIRNLLSTQANTVDWDRVMLIDRSSLLDFINANKLRKQVLDVLVETSDEIDSDATLDLIGVCSSPLSFSEMACLSAVKARELMAMYCTTPDVPLPTANHQKGNCGCIQSLIITGDIIAESAPSKSKAPKTSGEKSNTSNKPKKVSSLSRSLSICSRLR